jgi:hypothetical protein
VARDARDDRVSSTSVKPSLPLTRQRPRVVITTQLRSKVLSSTRRGEFAGL